jgi:hypothetical protein
MTRKTFWIIFAIAAALRVAYINVPPLWYDENFTLILARLPLDRLIEATAGDVHPPLSYLITWLVYNPASGQAPWMIRLPALLFSLLALYVFDSLCDTLRIPSRVRFAATVLMAVLPFQIWYAQEGRMYALLQLLVLTTLLSGLKRNWILFTLSAAAMLYTQNYGVFYLGVIICLLAVNDMRDALNLTVSGILAGMAYLPWAIVITNQMTEIEGRYWIMDAGPGAVLGALYKLFWASSMMSEGTLGSYFVTFVALILGFWALLGAKRTTWWIVMGMALAPLFAAWTVSLLWQPVLLFRPLIGIAPFLYLMVAWPVEWINPQTRNRAAALYTACFILPVFLLGIGGYYANIADMKGEGAVSPMLDTLATIRENWQAGDVLYYADDGPMINLMPYAADLPQYKMPACDERTGYAPVLGSLSDSTRAALGIPIADLADVPHRRAWVFAPRSPLHPECYEAQIAAIAPAGLQAITVDDNQFITSGVWLVTNQQTNK